MKLLGRLLHQHRGKQISGEWPRVCLVVMYFTIGGLERVVVRLANGLVARGIQTRVIIVETGKRNALITELDDRVELLCLEGSVLTKLSFLRRYTSGYITHLHFGDGYIHPLCRLALFGHKSLVITYHSVYSHLRNAIQTKLDHYMSRQFGTVVAVSESVREYCTQTLGIPERKIRIIYNGIDVGPEQIRSDWCNRPFELVSVAGLYKHKNQSTLIRGVAAARKLGLDVHLSLIGDGPEMARLFKLARELDVGAFITWHGAIWRREAVQEILNQADVFVTASKWEGFPVSLLEAMATEMPIIASNIKPHHEVLADCAIYFPPEDAVSLGHAIATLAGNSALGIELGKKAYSLVKMFSLERFIDHHIDIYMSNVRYRKTHGMCNEI